LGQTQALGVFDHFFGCLDGFLKRSEAICFMHDAILSGRYPDGRLYKDSLLRGRNNQPWRRLELAKKLISQVLE
jgi:hypothetical protein